MKGLLQATLLTCVVEDLVVHRVSTANLVRIRWNSDEVGFVFRFRDSGKELKEAA